MLRTGALVIQKIVKIPGKYLGEMVERTLAFSPGHVAGKHVQLSGPLACVLILVLFIAQLGNPAFWITTTSAVSAGCRTYFDSGVFGKVAS